MKIENKGDKIVAYRDENDVDSPNTGMNSQIKVGDSLGSISIETGKFTGNTVCLVELSQKREEYVQKLVDEVIEEVKSDVLAGDVTVLDEILKHVPIEVLIQSLPEERWKEFK